MEQLRTYLGRPRIWLAIAAPIAVQLIFFLIMLPALQGTEGRVNRLHIAIVSEDPGMGSQIAQQLAGKLPFTVDRPDSLAAAESSLKNGDTQMLVAFPKDFTQALQSGHATVRYQIDPAAAVMTKQVMAQLAQTMTEQLNTMAYTNAQQAVAQGVSANLQNGSLPPQVAQQVADNVSTAIRALNRSPVTADLGANAADANPLAAIVPMFVILLGFGGAVAAVALLLLTPASEGRWTIFAGLEVVLAIIAIVLPIVTIGLLAVFGQAFPQGAAASWGTLALTYWAMLLFVAALVRLFGRPGLALAALAVPFQVIAAGAFLPSTLLPGFYSGLARFTPGPYGARGLFHVMAGEAVPASTSTALWIVALVSLLVAFLATWIPRRQRSAAG